MSLFKEEGYLITKVVRFLIRLKLIYCLKYIVYSEFINFQLINFQIILFLATFHRDVRDRKRQ